MGKPTPPLQVDDHLKGQFRQPPCTPNALLGEWLHGPVSIRERAMLWLMNEITDDPGWRENVNNSSIVTSWRRQLGGIVLPPTLALPENGRVHVAPPTTKPSPLRLPTLPQDLAKTGFTEAMFDFCIRELRDKSVACEMQGHDTVPVFDSDAVVFKRTMSPTFNDRVKAALAPLEAEARAEGDYRDDHGRALLPIVNATLYPLVYGRTRVLETPSLNRANCISAMGSGTTVYERPPSAPWSRSGLDSLDSYWPSSRPDYLDSFWSYSGSWEREIELGAVRSRRFAWLPADVTVGPDGKCKVASYINNLHPKHVAVYDVIEQLLDAALPAFVAATWTVQATRFNRVQQERRALERDRRIPRVGPFSFFDCKSPNVCKGRCYVNPLHLRYGGVYSGSNRAREQKFRQNHPFIPPEPKRYQSSPTARQPLPRSFGGRWFPYGDGHLQVVVQINNHILTPANPTYEGGQWHVEGMVNEHIVASAVYYYDVDNVTSSLLSLGAAQVDINYDADEGGGYDMMASAEDRHVRNEAKDLFYGPRSVHAKLGGVRAVPGRMVVFPNVLEHRIEPFELVDKTREGTRKVITIFLVDPALSILSTSRVPPQQLRWADNTSVVGIINAKLPTELATMVYDEMECPYDMAVAREIRHDMMVERSGGARPKTHEPGAEPGAYRVRRRLN